VEADLAAGEAGGLVGGVVGSGVVSRAEQAAVLDRCVAAGAERLVVVGVTHAGWPVTALRGATALLQGEGDPLGFGVEPGLPAQVEDLGVGAEDGGDDPGPAGEPPGLIRWPVPSWAAFRPPIRLSTDSVTATVAETPPDLGSRSAG